MERDKIKVGQDYIYTVVRLHDDKGHRNPQREKKIVRCVGVYRHHARFDFGKYTRSLTWWDIEKTISTYKGGRGTGDQRTA